MAPDTDRRAQRGALPWLLGGLLAMGLELLGWVAARSLPGGGWQVLELPTRAAGAAGSLAFLAGLVLLSGARRAGRGYLALRAAALLWLGELALRLQALVGGSVLAAGGEPDAGGRVTAFRLIAAGCAACLLGAGMARLWRDRDGPRSTWRTAAWLFGLQVAALVLGPLVTDPRGLLPLAWLFFLGPYAWLLHCLRRTARELARRQGMSEHLSP